jgi:hypothetical protein
MHTSTVMYADRNFKTKKALKEAVANGDRIGVFQVGPFGGNEPTNGKVHLEGPHAPQPHRWYAQAILEDGVIVSVK